MESKYNLPKEFIQRYANLDWLEIQFGLDRGYIGEQTVQKIAVDRVTDESVPLSLELQIACLKSDELFRVRDILGVVDKGAESQDTTIRKWCFLVLQWIYDHRGEVSDPLGDVEEIYSDLNYPLEVADFIRYMPGVIRGNEPSDPQQRLLERWADYLRQRQIEFSPEIDHS